MFNIFNKPQFLLRRKELRKSPTPQESKLWFHLKNKKMGVKFRRQHGIGPYIADFYCKEKNLVIEVDGLEHLKNKEYDNERNKYMESLGLKVLRFWNSDIDIDIEKVIEKIIKEVS